MERERPLRVLHIIPTLTGGGAENFVCALLHAFDQHAIQAGVMPVYPTEIPTEIGKNNAVRILPVERRGRYDPGFFGRMVRGIREIAPDIVHAHLHNGKYWGRIAAMLAGVPAIVYTEHSPGGEKRIPPEVAVDYAINNRTAAVITFTERQRRWLASCEHIPLSKIRVIENGIPLPPLPSHENRIEVRRELGLTERDVAVLVVGRLEAIKNQQLAVRMMRYIAPAYRKRIRLYIVGTGSDEGALQELAAAMHVDDRTVFMGLRSDAVRLMSGADLLYIPSRVEGMPLAVLEAMCIGLPVMSSPWPAAPDVFQNGNVGVIVEDWTPQSAARTLETLLQNPQALQRLALRARVFSRRQYDIARIARLHEELYREVARPAVAAR